MSTNISINATVFDRATEVSLDTPVQQDALGFYDYTFAAVGFFDLETVPNISPSTPIWMQVAQVRQASNPAARFTFEVLNRATGQTQPLFAAAVDPASISWNVLIPQGLFLAIDADDGAVGPEGGGLVISFWQFGAREWPYLQCCHKFGPYESIIPA